jgi:hypothetical protein
MRSGEYGFDYIKNVYGRTAIKAKAAQKTNVIFAICNGRVTMRGKLCEFLGGGELVKRCDPMVEAQRAALPVVAEIRAKQSENSLKHFHSLLPAHLRFPVLRFLW